MRHPLLLLVLPLVVASACSSKSSSTATSGDAGDDAGVLGDYIPCPSAARAP